MTNKIIFKGCYELVKVYFLFLLIESYCLAAHFNYIFLLQFTK